MCAGWDCVIRNGNFFVTSDPAVMFVVSFALLPVLIPGTPIVFLQPALLLI